MKKKVDTSGGGSNWMDTYADMVTLLLCFFVLLFSMSTMDAEKYQRIAEALSSSGAVPNQTKIDDGSVPALGLQSSEIDSDKNLSDMLNVMGEYFVSKGMGESIEVYHDSGYEFVRFNDALMFEPNSYELKDKSKKVLDVFCEAIKGHTDGVSEIRVLGHTSQATASVIMDVDGDRFLSSNRANAVLNYINSKSVFPPEKLIAIGYGQHHPIAPFDTKENRAKNRRVEIIMFTKDVGSLGIDQIYTNVGAN